MVCTLKEAEVVGAIDRGEPVVWDKVPDNGIVDCDVARGDVVDVDMDDVGDDVDRGPIVEEDVEDGAGEEIVVDMYVASVLVQSHVQSNALDKAKHRQQLSLLFNVPLCIQVPFIKQ